MDSPKFKVLLILATVALFFLSNKNNENRSFLGKTIHANNFNDYQWCFGLLSLFSQSFAAFFLLRMFSGVRCVENYEPHKMVNTQKIRRMLLRNCLSIFDHFVGLPLKSLTHFVQISPLF